MTPAGIGALVWAVTWPATILLALTVARRRSTRRHPGEVA